MKSDYIWAAIFLLGLVGFFVFTLPAILNGTF